MHWNLADILYSKTFKKWAIEIILWPKYTLDLLEWKKHSLPVFFFNQHFHQTEDRKAKQVNAPATCVYWIRSRMVCSHYKTLHSSVLEPYREPVEVPEHALGLSFFHWFLAKPLLTRTITLEWLKHSPGIVISINYCDHLSV